MKPYLSHSEMYSWEKDRNEYYVQYILNVKPEPTRPMLLGTIIHDALSGNDKYEKELAKHNFTSNYYRIVKDILRQTPRAPMPEVPVYIPKTKENGLDVDVVCIFDGADPKENILHEYKTTENGWTNENDVKYSTQLALYSLAWRDIFGKKPIVRLHRLSTKNGKVKTYETVIEDATIRDTVQRLNACYSELTRLGWWERRIGKEDIINKAKKCYVALKKNKGVGGKN